MGRSGVTFDGAKHRRHEHEVALERHPRLFRLQGFETDADAFAVVGPWLRLTPAICAIVNAVGVWQGSAALFLAAASLSAGCFATGRHPFDSIYQYGIRYAVAGPLMPRYGAPPWLLLCRGGHLAHCNEPGVLRWVRGTWLRAGVGDCRRSARRGDNRRVWAVLALCATQGNDRNGIGPAGG